MVILNTRKLKSQEKEGLHTIVTLVTIVTFLCECEY
jgi:hypothetical protein